MDTTLVMIALAFAPTKPNVNFERRAEIKMVSVGKPAWIQTVAYPEGADPGEKFTTCYENRSGSCWTED